MRAVVSELREPVAAFSKADEGKIVKIKDGKVQVDGVDRAVDWGNESWDEMFFGAVNYKFANQGGED